MATPTKTRLPAAERRASIVDTAIDLFSRRGFNATTTRELAAACGVSEPVLYQHFETKRALYDAILESQAMDDDAGWLVNELAEATSSGDNHRFFTLLGTALLDWYTTDPRYARLLMFAALERHELSELFFQHKVQGFYGLITSHVQRQIEAGAFARSTRFWPPVFSRERLPTRASYMRFTVPDFSPLRRRRSSRMRLPSS